MSPQYCYGEPLATREVKTTKSEDDGGTLSSVTYSVKTPGEPQGEDRPRPCLSD